MNQESLPTRCFQMIDFERSPEGASPPSDRRYKEDRSGVGMTRPLALINISRSMESGCRRLPLPATPNHSRITRITGFVT